MTQQLIKQGQLYYLGIKVIIQNLERKILLLKHSKGYWDLPGGRIDPGENPLDALLREVREEIGWDNLENVKPDAMVLTPINIQDESLGPCGLILWYHTCICQKPKSIILSKEHVEYNWVSPLEAKPMAYISDIVAPHIFE